MAARDPLRQAIVGELLRHRACDPVLRVAGTRRGAVGDRGRRGRVAADDPPHAGQGPGRREVTPRARLVLFLATAPILGGLLLWGFAGLPAFGHSPSPYGRVLNAASVPERHITDVVTAVNLDYRGFDTLGEEFIFFAAAIGVVLILREQADERPGHVEDFATGRAVPPSSDAVRVLALGLTPLSVLFGIDIVAHGQLTPGGGFQGGVVLATRGAAHLPRGRVRRPARPLPGDRARASGGSRRRCLRGTRPAGSGDWQRLHAERAAAGPERAPCSRPARCRSSTRPSRSRSVPAW